MDNKEKLTLIEDVMDLDEGVLTLDTVLDKLEEWDSMSKLSLIVMLDDEFGKTIKGEDIRSFKTVKDIVDCME